MPEDAVLRAEADHSFLSIARKLYLTAFSALVNATETFAAESVQADGLKHIVQSDGPLAQGPAVWLIKHEYWYDAAYFPAWLCQKGVPKMRLPIAKNLLGPNLFSRALAWVAKPIFFEVHRTWRGEASTAEEKEMMRRENREMFERLKQEFYHGQHVVIFPEGTTMSDGRFTEIKSGVYNLAKVERDDGGLDLVQCVPVGLTYDYLGGCSFLGLKRSLIFLNFGKVMFYEPARRRERESDSDYVARDIAIFRQRVLDSFIDLNTYTASQLGGEYIMTLAEHGGGKVSIEIFNEVVRKRVEGLSALEGVVLDKALLADEGRRARVGRLYGELIRRQYLEEDGTLNMDRLLILPQLEQWRKQNILLYSVNRLRHIMEERPAIAEVISHTGPSSCQLR